MRSGVDIADRMRDAATALRETASQATPGPWRISGRPASVRYRALVSDTRHPGRPENGGWDWDEAYGGCLIAESLMPHDRTLIAILDPIVASALADWLDAVAQVYEHGHDSHDFTHPSHLADLILGDA